MTKRKNLTNLNHILEESKKRVLAKYPDIENSDSKIGNAFLKVLLENPKLLCNPNGPEIALALAECKLKQSKLDINIKKLNWILKSLSKKYPDLKFSTILTNHNPDRAELIVHFK